MVVEVSLSEITQKAIKKALELGLDVTTRGSIILDESMVFHSLSKALEKYGIIYVSIKDAIKNYPDIIEKYGEKIAYIRPEKLDNGVLLYVPSGVKVIDPIYTCFVLGRKGFVQRIYNLYVLEDNAEATVTKGCLSLVNEGAHSSVTEAHVGRNARLNSVMIHNWLPDVKVSSITRVRLLDKAVLYSYYINLSSVKRINYGTEIFAEGEGARLRTDTIVIGSMSSEMNYWSQAHLNASGSSAELISRMVGKDRVRINMKAKIVANAPNTHGHIECQGLQLSDQSMLSTIPVLESHISQTTLTHEASIGKISRDELEYLKARGFTEGEAVSLIVRGFIETGLDLVPEKLRPLIERILDELSRAPM